MISSRKVLVVVFVLFLFVGLVAVGCKQKTQRGWVNTDTLPGKTFSRYVKHDKAGNSAIVYLGNDTKKPDVNFGPGDVSFEFSDLR